MYTIKPTTRFQKDLSVWQKRGCNLALLTEYKSRSWREEKPLPAEKSRPGLGGDYEGFRECHITPDWLLIYQVCEDTLILFLTRTGSHSDLF